MRATVRLMCQMSRSPLRVSTDLVSLTFVTCPTVEELGIPFALVWSYCRGEGRVFWQKWWVRSMNKLRQKIGMNNLIFRYQCSRKVENCKQALFFSLLLATNLN